MGRADVTPARFSVQRPEETAAEFADVEVGLVRRSVLGQPLEDWSALRKASLSTSGDMSSVSKKVPCTFRSPGSSTGDVSHEPVALASRFLAMHEPNPAVRRCRCPCR